MIQNISIIALVLITLYYAVQTYRLVEQGKKKRDADFWEKRIEYFYFPFLQKLEKFKDAIADGWVFMKISETWDEIEEFYEKKKYMIPESTEKNIADFKISTLLPLMTGADPNIIYQMNAELLALKKLIEAKKKDTENQIRQFYGYGKSKLPRGKPRGIKSAA